MTKRHEQEQKIRYIVKLGMDFFRAKNINSTKGLMQTMILMNIDDKTDADKEEDLIDLMDLIQKTRNYNIRELAMHMWDTVERYYLFLVQVEADNFKQLDLLETQGL